MERESDVPNYFSEEELRCKCGCKRNLMQPAFLARLNLLRRQWGRPILLNSAYRCPTYNDKVSTTGTSGPHTTGRAVDIRVQGADALKLVILAEMCGFTGIGVAQKGSGRFIHVDDLPAAVGRPRPWLWSY